MLLPASDTCLLSVFTWLYLCFYLHVSPVYSLSFYQALPLLSPACVTCLLFFTWLYLCSHLHVSPVYFLFYLALPVLSPACVTLLNCLLIFYETLHSCSTQPADVHEGIPLLSFFIGNLLIYLYSKVLTPSVNRDIAEIHVYKHVHVDKSYKPFDLFHIYIFFENCRF